MPKLDEKLLSEYMENFFGYGNLNGNYWFIGMEEGGGDSFEEIHSRISQWDNRGREMLEDLYNYHIDINVPKWFRDKAPLQSTWNRLIRILLTYNEQEPDKEKVREYQIERLGRMDSDTALLELMPLPSPSTNHWLYADISDNPSLQNRDIYLLEIGKYRIEKLKQLITEYNPKFVIFYGIGYLGRWMEIIGKQVTQKSIAGKSVYFGKIDGTAIAITQHPTATGVTLDYFHEIGRELKSK